MVSRCGTVLLVAVKTAVTAAPGAHCDDQVRNLLIPGQVSSKPPPIPCQPRCPMVSASRQREGRTPTMTAIAVASPAVSRAGGGQDRREHRRKPSCPSRPRQQRDVSLTGSRQNSAVSVPAAARSLPVLFAELVELGREAWRIHQRERAVRAEIEALREIEENAPWQD
jgi:hypothetical protein